MSDEWKHAWPGLALIVALLALWAVTAVVDTPPSDAADALEESSEREVERGGKLDLGP